MKIALIGYGKMGHMVEEVALSRMHSIVAIVEHSSGQKLFDKVAEADVCLEFTRPDSVLENVKKLAAAGKDIVIGTTGWDTHIAEVRRIVEEAGVGTVYGSNFSIGVHLFFKMVRDAAALMNRFADYDVGVVEEHHQQKIDSPSGTAKILGNIISEAFPEKQLQISSLRCGSIPGTHRVVFDSPVDTITISHEARSREGFALGAVMAAEWVRGRKGLFTVDEMLGIGK